MCVMGFAIGADEGPRGYDFLSLRVHYLTAQFVPETAFWQVRKVQTTRNSAVSKLFLARIRQRPNLKDAGSKRNKSSVSGKNEDANQRQP